MLCFVLFIIVLVAALFSFLETKLLTKTNYIVSDNKLPQELDQKRIIVLSDLHHISFGNENERLLRLIQCENPDAVLICGDVINGNENFRFNYTYDLLTALKSFNIPVYYAYGNHELKLKKRSTAYYDCYTELSEKFSNLLVNKSVEIFKGVRLYGLCLELGYYKNNYSDEEVIDELNRLLGEPDNSDYNIILAHDPQYSRVYNEWGADVAVSGHLHGGIIRLPKLGGMISPRMKLFPKKDKGIFVEEGKKKERYTHIVSGGIGWHTLPFRFYNRPEIVIINFRKS